MQMLIEMLFLFFLGMGFVIEGSPIYNLGSFLIAMVFGFLYIVIDYGKERRKK